MSSPFKKMFILCFSNCKSKKLGQHVAFQLFLSCAFHMKIPAAIGPGPASASRLLPDVACYLNLPEVVNEGVLSRPPFPFIPETCVMGWELRTQS